MSDRVPRNCERDYLTVRLLARTDSATVFLARQRASGQQVALKLGDGAASSIERLTNEVLMTSRVDHPHVARIVDHGLPGDTPDPGLTDEAPWIAREFLPGPHLGDQIPVGGLQWQLAVQIAAQIASALAATHAAGVLHRDVKAGNVLKGADGSWKLTDFDVACDARHAAVQASTFAGTPGYVAPELIRGRPATVVSEVYALGAVLYLMLTGSLPHGGEDALELMQRCLEEDPVTPSAHGAELPVDLEKLVLAALSRKPELRPATMEVFRARLWSILLEPVKKLSASIPAGGAATWGAPRSSPGRRTTVKRALPATAARATRTTRAVPAAPALAPWTRLNLPRPVVTMMVCLLVIGCGLLATHGTLIGESPAGAPFRAMREAAARSISMAAGFGVPAAALKTAF